MVLAIHVGMHLHVALSHSEGLLGGLGDGRVFISQNLTRPRILSRPRQDMQQDQKQCDRHQDSPAIFSFEIIEEFFDAGIYLLHEENLTELPGVSSTNRTLP